MGDFGFMGVDEDGIKVYNRVYKKCEIISVKQFCKLKLTNKLDDILSSKFGYSFTIRYNKYEEIDKLIITLCKDSLDMIIFSFCDNTFSLEVLRDLLPINVIYFSGKAHSCIRSSLEKFKFRINYSDIRCLYKERTGVCVKYNNCKYYFSNNFGLSDYSFPFFWDYEDNNRLYSGMVTVDILYSNKGINKVCLFDDVKGLNLKDE